MVEGLSVIFEGLAIEDSPHTFQAIEEEFEDS